MNTTIGQIWRSKGEVQGRTRLYQVIKETEEAVFVKIVDGNMHSTPLRIAREEIEELFQEEQKKKAEQKVTIYATTEFFGSVAKYEGKLIEHGRRQYAQYKDAPYVEFVPKGCRKALRIQKAYKPYLIIVEGWGNPEPDDMMGEGETRGVVTVSKSRYSCFDDRYRTDFDEVLKKSNVKVIADYREGENNV